MPQCLLLPAGEDEDGIDEIECPDVGLHGDDSPARGEPSGSNAKFWEGLLKEKHEQLLKEEEQQVREQYQTSHGHHVDTSPALDPAGEPLPLPRLLPDSHVMAEVHLVAIASGLEPCCLSLGLALQACLWGASFKRVAVMGMEWECSASAHC